jgi:hypothetical protein
MNITSFPTSPSIARVAGSAVAERVDELGGAMLRYGLVAILLFFGAFKFTPPRRTESRG